MKKAIIIVLAIVICLSACSCSKKDTADYAKEAFANIDSAYDLTNTFSHDIYEAWFMGINESEEITEKNKYLDDYYETGFNYFCGELDIEREHIEEAVRTLAKCNNVDLAYYMIVSASDSLFSSMVHIVTNAYEISGKTYKIESYIKSAREAVIEISISDSEYEHYNDLKCYLAETKAFFDFCKSPEGSFEQVKDTFNDYRNNSRKYYNTLSLFFDDPNDDKEDALAEDALNKSSSDSPLILVILVILLPLLACCLVIVMAAVLLLSVFKKKNVKQEQAPQTPDFSAPEQNTEQNTEQITEKTEE